MHMEDESIKNTTLCLIRQPERMLLGMKKRGFGAGKWNGFGGKVESGETIAQAAARELEEEAGVRAEMELAGILELETEGEPVVVRMHIFRAERCEGEPTESEEMRPRWFPVGELPFGEMWPDDPYWMPLFLAGKKFQGRFRFDRQDRLLGYELEEAADLS